MATRRELVQATAERYRSARRFGKKQTLGEFVQLTGFHRKHAIRALQRISKPGAAPALRAWLYDEATVHSLTML